MALITLANWYQKEEKLKNRGDFGAERTAYKNPFAVGGNCCQNQSTTKV